MINKIRIQYEIITTHKLLFKKINGLQTYDLTYWPYNEYVAYF